MIANFEAWKEELLFTGNIIQDEDDTVSPEERARRCTRYGELLDAVDGTEGYEVFQALIDSLQAKQDYGVYQTTYNVLWSFRDPQFAEYLIKSLPSVIRRNLGAEDLSQVGNILAPIDSASQRVEQFNMNLARSPHEEQEIIFATISKLIDLTWLNEDTGLGWI